MPAVVSESLALEPRACAPDSAISVVSQLTKLDFQKFQSLIQQEAGIHLKEIKSDMLSARLVRRVKALQLSSYTEYYEYLLYKDPLRIERRTMINCVTTNLTAFFRESHHFDYLGTWLKTFAMHNKRLRVWSAACSTGQEPYSIGITVQESLGQRAQNMDLRLLASDLDTEVLDTARKGVYAETDIDKLSLDLKRKYFLRGKGTNQGLAQVKRELQRPITFEQVNLIGPNWPSQQTFDVIFCRNVLIYFDEPTCKKVIERLLSVLAPKGLLFIGHSESLHWLHSGAKAVGHAIYQAT